MPAVPATGRHRDQRGAARRLRAAADRADVQRLELQLRPDRQLRVTRRRAAPMRPTPRPSRRAASTRTACPPTRPATRSWPPARSSRNRSTTSKSASRRSSGTAARPSTSPPSAPTINDFQADGEQRPVRRAARLSRQCRAGPHPGRRGRTSRSARASASPPMSTAPTPTPSTSTSSTRPARPNCPAAPSSPARQTPGAPGTPGALSPRQLRHLGPAPAGRVEVGVLVRRRGQRAGRRCSARRARSISASTATTARDFSSNPSPSIYTWIDGYALTNFRARLPRRRRASTSSAGCATPSTTKYFEQLHVGPGNTGLIAGKPGDPRTWGGTIAVRVLAPRASSARPKIAVTRGATFRVTAIAGFLGRTSDVRASDAD